MSAMGFNRKTVTDPGHDRGGKVPAASILQRYKDLGMGETHEPRENDVWAWRRN